MVTNLETKQNYPNLYSSENLELAFRKARKGKTSKNYVVEFETNLKQNLLILRTELMMHTYKPSPLKTFIIRDPKTRKISKSTFKDRIVHHAICNIIETEFDKTFIYDSYANRIGKGSINAIKRFDYFKRKVSKNNTNPCFVLKADIKQYFENVDHEILITILKSKIKDNAIIWLIKLILGNYKTKKERKGMPLGNLTSQFFANVYLNEFDQFVKHELKIKHYIRYVDDFIILHDSRDKLEIYRQKINDFLKEALNLELHEDKTKIISLKKGVHFLGFKIFPHHRLIKKKNKKKFERKLQDLKKRYSENETKREKIIEIFEGWITYSSQANTYKYRKKLTSRFNQYFPIKKDDTQIKSVKLNENINNAIFNSELQFSQQKTLFLLKKGHTIKQIAEKRNIKENTVWDHIATLIDHHQLKLKEILPNDKIKKIMTNIRSSNDTLKDIKERIKDDTITYNEINCILANIKGKHKKKNINYFIQWYKKVNCHRKCYYNKKQREECRIKFQKMANELPNLKFTKNEFLNFFNNHTTICTLSTKEKKQFIP